jgi:hypothetical protein
VTIVSHDNGVTANGLQVVETLPCKSRGDGALSDASTLFAIAAGCALYLGTSNHEFLKFFNPFWLVVLLISIQYGMTLGIFATLLATLGSFALWWPSAAANQDLYDYLLTIAIDPIMWLVCAFFVGSIRDRQLQSQKVLAKQLSNVQQQLDTVSEFSKNLETKLIERDRLLAMLDDASCDAVLEKIADLRERSLADLPEALGDSMCSLFGEAVAFAISAHSDKQSRRVFQYGEIPELPGQMGHNRPDDASGYEQAAIIVAPIRHPQTRIVLGAVTLHYVEPDQLNRLCEIKLRLVAGELWHALEGAAEDDPAVGARHEQILEQDETLQLARKLPEKIRQTA